MNVATGELRRGGSRKESHFLSSSEMQRYPIINTSGSKIAFSGFENGKRSVYLWTADSAPEKLCEGCLRATDWSHDEKRLLIFDGIPIKSGLLTLPPISKSRY